MWIRLYRPVNSEVKRVTIRRSGCDKWYASLTVEADAISIQRRVYPVVGRCGFGKLCPIKRLKIADPRFFRREVKNWWG